MEYLFHSFAKAMSKLPKAPLIEVIFEIRWQIKQKSDITNYEYLIGDLYSLVKSDYPHRESLLPPGMPSDIILNNPAHRFRKEKDGYPLIQIGPGVITLNTNDEYYFWNEYYDLAKNLLTNLFETNALDNYSFNTNLLYLDFFEFDFSKSDVNDFVNDMFNINVTQGFLEESDLPFNLDIGFFYGIPLGNLAVTLKKGAAKGKEGIVMQTSLYGNTFFNETKNILSWLTEAHEFSSNLFKKITAGKLYESFH